MRTTIVIGEENSTKGYTNATENRHFYYAGSEAEGHLYHIEHPEVDSYIISHSDFNLHEINSLIEHVHFLNSIITIIILHSGELQAAEFKSKKNIHLCNNERGIPDLLKNLPKTQRDSNRIEWPVKVVFKNQDEADGKSLANILSISSGGCFISTEKKYNQGTLIIMTIKFKDFDLFTEGEVLRLSGGGGYQPEGIAVRFLRISPQTKNCIQSIIDEKILGDLMKKLNPNKDIGEQ